ncbi:MAG: type I glutamate--ammonia ligase [Firmicutes bacterium]|nr:type I glutamate--ammonia ligase [Bacillota bacterium]
MVRNLNQSHLEIIEQAKEKNVRFIQLHFTDILGTLKTVTITSNYLTQAMEEGVLFDGSSIQGFARIHESDMYLHPDLNTFSILPWVDKDGDVIARFICDVFTPQGEPFQGCPRNALKKVIDEAKTLGYQLIAGLEPEFFLFETDEKGNPINITQDRGGYFDLSPVDKGEEARNDIVKALELMGFQIEASHHEVAPGQHEIDFHFTDALTAADNIMAFKFVTKAVAKKHKLHATFIPKPIQGENGSGLHIHQSLHQGERNVFYDPEAEDGISQIARFYIGGLLKHAKAITAITNPTVNSYKRLVPGFEAPVDITWSIRNRSSLIRIPSVRNSIRLEYRSPDPSTNPYLALACILKAGLTGIREKIEPPPQINEIAYDLSLVNRKERGIEILPDNLREALEALSEDHVIQSALGEHIYEHFMKARLIEWGVYRNQVHQWELEQYLTTL